MNKVYACIDALASSAAVIDLAAWSALRLDAPLALMHVLEEYPERAAQADYSGTIGLGAQEALLTQLSGQDAPRNTLAQEAGRQLLSAASTRAAAAGVAQPEACLRHGELVANVLALEPQARLFVLGEHERAVSPVAKIHLDHRVERVIRSVKCPVLVATGEPFVPPQRMVLAFDGSAAAHKTVETVAISPLLKGLPVLLVMAGADSVQASRALDTARQTLADAGFDAHVQWLPGEPETVLPALLKAQDGALLVMGAYGHSRLRQFIAGSTTSTLLRLSQAPVLILR